MIILEYDPHNGKAVPDGYVGRICADIVADMNNDCHYHISYSTENIFNEIRIHTITEVIDVDRVCFYFEGQTIRLNGFGDCSPHPEGFLSDSALRSRNIMLGGSNKRIAIKNGEWIK